MRRERSPDRARRGTLPLPTRLIRLAFCFALAFVSTATTLATARADSTTTRPASTTAPSGIGLRLVDVPAAAREDPRARIYIVDHLGPGAVIARRIEVTNTSALPLRIDLYAAAATIAGETFRGAAGRTPNDLSTWTSVVPQVSDVPANGRVTATVTIAVPRDTPTGERFGVVWAEAGSRPAAGGGITQVSRVGIRLYLSIGPGAAPAPNFAIASLTAERARNGQPRVVASVHNTGGRALDLNGTLQLSAGPGGLSAGPFAANLTATLAIGDTEPVTIALDKQVPAGPWRARITLHSGLLERSAGATITFPATGSAIPVSTASTRSGLSHALVLAGVAGVLVAGAAALLLTGRRVRVSRRASRHRPAPSR